MTVDKLLSCPLCGLNYPASAKFCGQDGTLLLPAVGLENTKSCPKCKKDYPDYVKHCPVDGIALDAPQVEYVSFETEIIGKTVAGKYKIESLLGEGGMAQVFKARHLGLDRPVVIKLMHRNLPSQETALKRFEQECKVTAKIDHPNVVSVFDVGTFEAKRPYLVMEFIQGESLRDLMERERSPEMQNVLRTMSQICAGLQAAHAEGIIHRDLKPENIMLRQDQDRPDWVKIVDFGIAHLKQGGQRLTKTGIAIGTVDYMSPEYLGDKPIDHRSDIYALGVIFFELIAGRCPFAAETSEAIMAKHLFSEAPPLSMYRPDLKTGSIFDLIAKRALEKVPEKRYQSIEAMQRDINEAFKECDRR
ncbi:MAG: serine/threonine protein kinase [Candidatus Obscuribacterales bacterium]|nr:serine/threonine protein kinase [Candidatus Obscuribacterales bacterium]